MEFKRILSRGLILALVALNFGCDQVTKNLVRTHIDYYESIKMVKGYLTLTKVENSGAFLSTGDSLPESFKFILLMVLPALVLAYGVIFLMSKANLDRLMIIGSSFVIGGGIGNLYDRWIYGSVTDFLHIDFVIFETGVFNVADMSIMAGMFLLLISFYKRKSPELSI